MTFTLSPTVGTNISYTTESTLEDGVMKLRRRIHLRVVMQPETIRLSTNGTSLNVGHVDEFGESQAELVIHDRTGEDSKVRSQIVILENNLVSTRLLLDPRSFNEALQFLCEGIVVEFAVSPAVADLLQYDDAPPPVIEWDNRVVVWHDDRKKWIELPYVTMKANFLVEK